MKKCHIIFILVTTNQLRIKMTSLSVVDIILYILFCGAQ